MDFLVLLVFFLVALVAFVIIRRGEMKAESKG